jgi:hypothetical protein
MKYRLYIPYDGFAEPTFKNVTGAIDYMEKERLTDVVCSVYQEDGEGKLRAVCQIKFESKRGKR